MIEIERCNTRSSYCESCGITRDLKIIWFSPDKTVTLCAKCRGELTNRLMESVFFEPLEKRKQF